MNLDDRLHDLAARQHGLVTRHQATSLGASQEAVLHRLRKGAWSPVGLRVLRAAGSVPTPKQELMAAVLDASSGAVASHEAAAALWSLPGFPPGPLDVTRPRSSTRMRPTIGEVHESRRLPAEHCTVIDGIPATGLARTLFDLAGAPSMPAPRVERAVDNALARSPLLLVRLHRMLRELTARGRPGIGLMRALLAVRPEGYVPPASGLEARALELLHDAGIRTERQVDIGDAEWIGRVDFRVVGTHVVVEVDSAVHHTSLADRRRDAARDAACAKAGLVVVRVTDEEVFQRPWVLESRVRRALAPDSGTRRPGYSAVFASQLRGVG
jgi:very-short-patch-repair endonuclease